MSTTGRSTPMRSATRPCEYRRIAMELALELLDWVEANTPPEIAARLSMPLSKMMEGSKRTLLRVLRYPPLPDSIPDGAVRAAAHEDINLLTVLPASDAPGLELLDTNGQWHPVPCDPGSLAINGGEMLDLATEGYYPATTHRVVNPTGPDARRAACRSRCSCTPPTTSCWPRAAPPASSSNNESKNSNPTRDGMVPGTIPAPFRHARR